MKLIIINGPNLNLLGVREKKIYGNKSFESLFDELQKKYNDISLEQYQSNHEGEIIEKIQEVGFVGKSALKEIRKNGVHRKQIGLEIKAEPMVGPNTRFWDIKVDNQIVGYVTSAAYSPRLKKNIALAMILKEHSIIGNDVEVISGDKIMSAEVVEKPFFDPRKTAAKS